MSCLKLSFPSFDTAFVRLKKALVEEDMIGALSLVDVQIDAPSSIRDDEAYSWACEHGMGGGVLNQVRRENTEQVKAQQHHQSTFYHFYL